MHQKKYLVQQFIRDVLKKIKYRITSSLINQRIAHNKKLSIPRLELLAILIGARSLNFVEKPLQLKIK